MKSILSQLVVFSVICSVFLLSGVSAQTANDFNRYWTYTEIVNYINGLPARFNFVTIHTDTSTELRQIQMVKIGMPNPEGLSKPAVFITSGLIAREWVNVMVCVNLIFQLTQNSVAFRDVLEVIDFHIVPLLNPDGYVFSHDVDRAWVKNRFLNSNSPCIGINVNRNFGVGHSFNPAIRDPCSDEFGDRMSMTQREQRVIMNWIRDFWSNTRGYINIENYGSRLLYPFAYHEDLNPHRGDLVIPIAQELLTTLNSFTSQPYTLGKYADIVGRVHGTSVDHFHDRSSIHRSYAIHPRSAGPNGYDAPPNQLMGIINEVFPTLIHFGQIIGREFGGRV